MDEDKEVKQPKAPQMECDSPKKEKKSTQRSRQFKSHQKSKRSPPPKKISLDNQDKVFIEPTISTLRQTFSSQEVNLAQSSVEIHSATGFVRELVLTILEHVGSSHKLPFDQSRDIILTLRHHLEVGLLAYLRASSLTTTMPAIANEFNKFAGRELVAEPYLVKVINAFMPLAGAVQLTWEDCLYKIHSAIRVLNNSITLLKSGTLTPQEISQLSEVATQGINNKIIQDVLKAASKPHIHFFETKGQAYSILHPSAQVVKIEGTWMYNISQEIFSQCSHWYNANYKLYRIKVRATKYASRLTNISIQFLHAPPPDMERLLVNTCSCLEYNVVHAQTCLLPAWAEGLAATILIPPAPPTVQNIRSAPSRMGSPTKEMNGMPLQYTKKVEEEEKKPMNITNPAGNGRKTVRLTLTQARTLYGYGCTFNQEFTAITLPSEQSSMGFVLTFCQQIGQDLAIPESNGV